MRKNKKHYSERRHQRTSPGTPPPVKMSRKLFRKWAREWGDVLPTELPFGYSIRDFIRVRKLKSALYRIRMSEHSPNYTYIRRLVKE